MPQVLRKTSGFHAAVRSAPAVFLPIRASVSHGNLEPNRLSDLVPEKKAGFFLGPAPARTRVRGR